MKKVEIKKAVERAADKFMPKAVREEGAYRAREEVREAMYQEPAQIEAPSQAPARSGTAVISSAEIEQRLGRG